MSNNKYVLIFAKTPYYKTPYDVWLEGTSISPIILTSEEYAPEYSHLPHVISFKNYDHNWSIQKAADEIILKYQPIAIFARAEADVLRAAQLRDRHGIPGQTYQSALAFRNKWIMKSHLPNSKKAEAQLITSPFDIMDFIQKNGYPVVIKPTTESGSYGTTIINNIKELNHYMESPLKGETLIEKFVNGKMYHVDGLILNGQLKFIQPFEYINDCLAFRRNDYLGSATLASNNPLYERLKSETYKVLQQMPVSKNMAFHAEFWHTDTDHIVFCEIASRTGGGMISTLVQHSFGLNIDKEWFLAECGINKNVSVLPLKMGAFVLLQPQVGILEKLPTAPAPHFVKDIQYCGKEGQIFHGGVKSGLFLAGFIIDGETQKELHKNILQTSDWFTHHTQWKPLSEAQQ